MTRLLLPPGIRYECIRCGLCCRSLEVTLTEAEHQALAAQDWTRLAPGLTADRLFARIRRPRGRHTWRLRPRPSGACRFLTEEGLCRVHSVLGHDAKPFAGRLFPFTFLRTPVGVFVGVRFNCPAVARGIGPPLAEQRERLARLYDEYVRTYAPPVAPHGVPFFGRYQVTWEDARHVEEQLIGFLRLQELDLPARLLACRRLVAGLAGGAVKGGTGGEVGADPQAILASLPVHERAGKGLSRIERAMVRLLVAAFLGARLPSFRELSAPRRLAVRLGNLLLRLRMAVGLGRVTLPGEGLRASLRQSRAVETGRLDGEMTRMLERYYVAKVASQGFFGPSFFGRSFAEGLDFLAASLGVVLWLASARAAASGRRSLEAGDVECGIRVVDYGFNFVGQFGGLVERMRAVLFWHWGTTERLLGALRPPQDSATG